MTANETRNRSFSLRRARRLGLTALAATTIAGIALTQVASANPLDVASTISLSSASLQPNQAATVTYADGSYTGNAAAASRWGSVQLDVTIANGQISDIQFLQYPNHRSHSLQISRMVLPYLAREVITNQSANVDFITGATFTVNAFVESLQSALDQAAGTSASSSL